MTKNSIMRSIAAVCSVTFLAIVGYAQDKPIKKDLKFTIIPNLAFDAQLLAGVHGAPALDYHVRVVKVGPSEAVPRLRSRT